MSFLGEDWKEGPDGIRYRHAARVLLFDDVGRLLLARGHDLDNPSRHWWFTIGGGRDEGEGARAAAVRELREETGITLDPSVLVGPVLTRSAVFDFAAETVRQYEVFFAAHLTEPERLSTDGWTHVERAMIDGLKWWDLTELQKAPEQVYPEGIADIAVKLARGWDGEVIRLGEVHDPK